MALDEQEPVLPNEMEKSGSRAVFESQLQSLTRRPIQIVAGPPHQHESRLSATNASRFTHYGWDKTATPTFNKNTRAVSKLNQAGVSAKLENGFGQSQPPSNVVVKNQLAKTQPFKGRNL